MLVLVEAFIGGGDPVKPNQVPEFFDESGVSEDFLPCEITMQYQSSEIQTAF